MMRPSLRIMKAYTPVDPVDVLTEHASVPTEETAKLDGNENPYGCSPRVKEALAECQSYNRYPDPEQRVVRRAIAKYVGIDPKHIVAGA